MMERMHIDVFIDGLTRYFKHLDSSRIGDNLSLEISAPYLLESTQSLGLDYTGMISVSGSNSGIIFVSAKNALLKLILLSLGESEFSSELKRDLIGEIANTLAGNARRHLGEGFHISTPRVIKGPIITTNYRLSSRCYVLPFRWKSNKAELIISI